MGKREFGQVFILVLILLAIGSILLIPALRLISTSFKSSQIVIRQTNELALIDAAQEYILWKIQYTDFTDIFTYNGQSESFTFEVCGVPVAATVIMRAVEGGGGITLAKEHVIRPTKTVEPSTVPNNTPTTYTYIIGLDQVSCNTSQGLDAIYDILPSGFGPLATYIAGSSFIRVDSGDWELLPDPDVIYQEGHWRLRWPGSGNFTSPMRDFLPGQMKELKFEMDAMLRHDNDVECNWIVLKPWNTLSGALAKITVGTPTQNTCSTGLLEVTMIADPAVVEPGVQTIIDYAISITNHDIHTRQLNTIIDYLPPEIFYIGPTAGLTTQDPEISFENINGLDRFVLLWDLGEEPIGAGETLNLAFRAQTTMEVSGSYGSEVVVLSDIDEGIREVFEIIGVSQQDYCSTYSWNTGTVIVPAYDSQVQSGGTTGNANITFTAGGGISISSWQIK